MELIQIGLFSLIQSVSHISKANSLLLTSQHFYKLFEIVLAIGNYMNGSTGRGGCYGFQLDSLTKLMDVKSVSSTQTLAHWLAEFLGSKHPETLTFLSDKGVDQIHESTKDSLTEVVGSIGKLKTNLAPITTQISSASCDEALKASLGDWVSKSTPKVESLVTKSNELQTQYKQLLNFYALPQTTKSEDLFAIFSKFIDTIKRCQAENSIRAKGTGQKATTVRSSSGPAQGELGDLMAQMKNGNLFKVRQANAQS